MEDTFLKGVEQSLDNKRIIALTYTISPTDRQKIARFVSRSETDSRLSAIQFEVDACGTECSLDIAMAWVSATLLP